MEPILHIGYQKTATTWLQKVVLKHHPELALVLRSTKGADWLENSIGQHPFAFKPDRIRTAYSECIEPFLGRLPFVSHEAWIGDPYTGGRNTPENARRLHAIFPEARVVIVVREPIDMIKSMYRQYVQEGGALDCDSLLTARYPQRTYFDRNFLNYDEVLDLYVGLFGRDRVCALPYELVVDSPQQFLDDLLKFCGVSPLNLDDIKQRRKQRPRNRGLSMPSLAVARRLNRILGSAFNPTPLLPQRLATWRELRHLLQRRVDPRLGSQSWNDSGNPLLSNERVEQLESHYRPHNERLEREYGIAFPSKPG
ncbi:MAG: sulfotransferase [Deltaproteobacteria bacterium]|nr:sulfotransferase [Deltaproteobacteria bacterium]MBW2391272.1 sulfotransferase [Deltaproteobacteria bacterium]MBW2724405.1 sulfotransferase [Deltaproteobacteria bacterium]